MKKTLVTFIIIAVALVACMTTVEAASFGVKVTPSATEVKKGDTVTVAIAVNNLNVDGQGLTALFGVIEYDTTVFNTLSAENFKALNGWDTPTFNANNNKVLTAKGGYQTTDSDIFEITFTVKDTAKLGSTNITLKNITGSDNESDIDATDASCAVQIVEKTTTDVNKPIVDGGTTSTKPNVVASYTQVANGVKVTLTSDKQLKTTAGWELSTDKKQLTRIYTSNYTGVITVEDVDGNKSDAITLNVEIANSGNDGNNNYGTTEDKTPPTASVSYTKGTNGVTVKVVANEEIKPVTGWTLSADKTTLTRIFAANYTGTVVLEDLAGNKSSAIDIKVDISATNGGTNVDNAGDKNPSNSNNSNNNTNTKVDSLPKAGAAYVMPVLVVVALIAIVTFARYKSMEY